MKTTMIPTSLVFILGAMSCAGPIFHSRDAGLSAAGQVDRLMVVDYDNPMYGVDGKALLSDDGKQRMDLTRCLEFQGPGAVLDDVKVNFDTTVKVDAQGVPVTVGNKTAVANTESLARMYTVGNILQFAHAMSFRLCEARRNGDISGPDYLAQFGILMSSTNSLLGKEVELAQEQTKQADAETKTAEADAKGEEEKAKQAAAAVKVQQLKLIEGLSSKGLKPQEIKDLPILTP